MKYMQRYPFSNQSRLIDEYIFLGVQKARFNAIICVVWNHEDSIGFILISKLWLDTKNDISIMDHYIGEHEVVNSELDIHKYTLTWELFELFWEILNKESTY